LREKLKSVFASSVQTKKPSQRQKMKRRSGFFLSSPLIMFLCAFLIVPIYLGIKTSFSKDILSNPNITPAGFGNFKNLIHDPTFWSALNFTMRFAVVTTILELIIGFLLALLFDATLYGKKILFSFMLVPIMIAPSLLAIMFRLILNDNIGVIPAFFHKIGLNFFAFDHRWVFWTLVILDMLQYTAFTFLLWYSILQGISQEIYESAAIDGASYWQTRLRVVLPLIKPSLIIIMLLRFLDSMRTFDSVYILTGGGPGSSTETIGIYIYKTAFISGNFGLASSASIGLALILIPFMPSIIRRFRFQGDK
jgi:multiple sugar transport system permease protein